ncbi:methylthioribose-1-phosphate isomerase [Methylomarinovum tepidoasis]|uniref:Methylthioribose-1-phosphate isomerase n=1 Tax=Methylomarinovum tepidoasis TaxID=2840183 RepID=A0AAU9CC96_9GAMM|nr:S-methyl-5-thioribose-1-phosphate isomerase [Methylomarinovum sp. IN45]BCX88381.1 methylthioribose-1-phosphate isomerase [Methylomarinovum sp. IN45]
MHPSAHDRVRPLRWTGTALEVLDQRLLPDRCEYRRCTTAAEVAAAIAAMQVRGAPAIGIAAAYGVVLAACQRFREAPQTWRQAIEADFARLVRSRPTAVNLVWALERMRRVVLAAEGDPCPAALAEAERIHAEDVAANRRMGELGAEVIGDLSGILTHCNTGSLATGGFGTALGVIRTLWQRRPGFTVHATETRPWNQGARLTLWELEQDGIPATLIADSAAAFLMCQGRVQWVVVGADRIAANGDTANKIGTYALAVAARRHGVKLMVVAPTATIDWNTPHGGLIPIEERDPAELLPAYYQREDSLAGAWNPVFDVTPADLISAIVTEKGVVRPGRDALETLRG